MNPRPAFPVVAALVVAMCLAGSAHAQPRVEVLGRGVVALQQPDGAVFVSWRLLASDPENVAFNVYRTTAAPAGRGFGGGGRGGPGGGAAQPPAAGAAAPQGQAQPAQPPQRGGRGGPGGGGPQTVKLNDAPLTTVTWLLDARADLSRETSYFVRTVIGDVEGEPSAAFKFAANAAPQPYLSIPLQTPEGYTPNDASVGDLDGDGEYEIILHQTGVGRDNAQAGMTSEPVFQAYKLDGTLLWTINLGKNVREGAHYTQFLVADFDGDGRAEFACKTADGSKDATGRVIGDPTANWVEPEGATVTTYRRDGTAGNPANVTGRILKGPEYLTIFDGRTGAALTTVDYVPQRHPETHSPTPQQLAQVWGDSNANRSDRFLACVAYLDGELPSMVFCRGYYTRAVLAAWDWRGGKLTQRWVFDSDDGTPGNEAYRGQGDHGLSVADVDGDGRQEIVYGAAVIDDDGKGLYSTGWGHGDAMHVGDLVVENPGLEVFNIQERFDAQGMNMRDAKTGRPIFLIPSRQAATEGGDAGEGPGRGNAINIDPRFPGAESWANGADMDRVGILDARGQKIAERPPGQGLPCNFAVWWDGDLLRELLDQNRIVKWNWVTEKVDPLLVAHACTSANGTKATPAVSADLFGDWREEVVWATRDRQELRIYTTTIPTPYRMVTLMHDPQYRVAIAWQNTAYNQPPHPSFYLDPAAPLPPWPKVKVGVMGN